MYIAVPSYNTFHRLTILRAEGIAQTCTSQKVPTRFSPAEARMLHLTKTPLRETSETHPNLATSAQSDSSPGIHLR